MNELIEYALIENSVELLNDFFSVISDGYNPTMINIGFSLEKQMTNEELFVFDTSNHIGSKEFYEKEILPTETKIIDIQNRINENFNWCLSHLESNTKAPGIFQSDYHFDNLKRIINRVKNRILSLIESRDWIACEYLIDSKDGSLERVMKLVCGEQSIVIRFGNFIH